MRVDTYWNTEVIAEFKRLYDMPAKDRLSFSQIAASLSYNFQIRLSRNACIGKAMRLGWARAGHGLPRIPRPPRPTGVRKARKPDEQKMIRVRTVARVNAHHSENSPHRKLRLVEAEIPDTATDDIPAAQRKTLLELTNDTCRWPCGEPSEPGFFFCGAPADLQNSRPYCAAHAIKARGRHYDLSEAERHKRSQRAARIWRERKERERAA